MNDTTALERVLRRDRAVVAGGLFGVIALAWLYLVGFAGPEAMPMGAAMTEAAAAPWSAADAALMLVMWAVMMVAMMVPSAAPMILLFAAIGRKRRREGGPYVPTAVFALGYAIVWTGFALGATGLQWALTRTALLSPAMASASAALGGLLLIAAGLYQLTPLKRACLARCRSPLDFVLHRWRSGPKGALLMGLEHGAFCLGCCWALMGLLFVGGVMNFVWIAAIAAFVLLEKTVPAGHRLGRATGVALMLWGGAVLAGAAAG